MGRTRTKAIALSGALLMIGSGALGNVAAQAPRAVVGAAERPAFASAADSMESERVRRAAEGATGRRVVVSLRERRLWWIDNRADTVMAVPVAVGKGDTLRYNGKTWEFGTPRGVRRVLARERNPVWVPPLWHFVERARERGRPLVELVRGRPYRLGDGSRVEVRGDRVGRVLASGEFIPAEPGQEVVYDEVLFVPPLGTVNRRVPGELGAYKLDLGDGYLIHGTPHKDSIGTAATHGCIRVADDALAALFIGIRPGTPVYIY